METIIEFVQQNADYAPILVFALLLLAGLNVPISEDGLIFVSALISRERPDLLVPLIVATLSGAYLGDAACYMLGRKFGPTIWKHPWFKRMVPPKTVRRIASFYDRYGILTIVVGRFIPFGVRNGLFLTAGLGKMAWARFLLSDLVAACISIGFYFWLYHRFGPTVIEAVRQGNLVIFGVAVCAVATALVRLWLKRRASHPQPATDAAE